MELESTKPAQTLLLSLPMELLMHHVFTLLPVQSLLDLMLVNKQVAAVARTTMAYAHPVTRYLFLPAPAFCTLSFAEWKRHILDRPDVRRSWLRLLSKQKKWVPLWCQDEVKLVISSLVGECIRQGHAEVSHLTSMLYRSFSVILGMYDRHPSASSSFSSSCPPCPPSATFGGSGTSSLSLAADDAQPLSLPDNLRWIKRAIGSPAYFSINEQLLPSMVRSLFWIQKEKFNKRRLVAQVELVFMALPSMLGRLPPDSIRRFVKGLSDEARSIKQRLQQVPLGRPSEPEEEQEAPAPFHAPPPPPPPLVMHPNGGGMEENPHPNPHPHGGNSLQHLQNDALAAMGQTQNAPQRPFWPVLEPTAAWHAAQAAASRRAFEPIKLAVMVCSRTATLYPYCFNAQTLATVIRNTFNLVAWGMDVSDIKYDIFRLCQSILDDVDTLRPEPLDGSSILNGRDKLQAIVALMDEWMPAIVWDPARETLTDVRELFRVHVRRMERR